MCSLLVPQPALVPRSHVLIRSLARSDPGPPRLRGVFGITLCHLAPNLAILQSLGVRSRGHCYRADRYTEWVAFGATEKHKPDWTKNVGTELYDHSVDIQENANLAGVKANAALVAELSGQLHRGPTTGGAWGPH